MTINAAWMSGLILPETQAIVAECVNTEAPLVQWLDQQGASEDFMPGDDDWRVESAAGHGAIGTHAEGGAYTAPDQMTLGHPVLPDFGRYSESVQITETQLLRLQNGATTAVENLVLKATMNAMKMMLRKVATSLIANDQETPGDANAPHGIESWISATNTVAGIARGANAYWQANIDATGGGAAVTAVQVTGLLTTAQVTRGASKTGFTFLGTAGQMNNVAALATVPAITAILPMDAINRPALPVGPTSTSPLGVVGYYNGVPCTILPGATNTRVNLLKIGNGDGFRLLWLKRPTISEFQQVQGTANFIATVSCELMSKLDNPWKHAGAITALLAAA